MTSNGNNFDVFECNSDSEVYTDGMITLIINKERKNIVCKSVINYKNKYKISKIRMIVLICLRHNHLLP